MPRCAHRSGRARSDALQATPERQTASERRPGAARGASGPGMGISAGEELPTQEPETPTQPSCPPKREPWPWPRARASRRVSENNDHMQDEPSLREPFCAPKLMRLNVRAHEWQGVTTRGTRSKNSGSCDTIMAVTPSSGRARAQGTPSAAMGETIHSAHPSSSPPSVTGRRHTCAQNCGTTTHLRAAGHLTSTDSALRCPSSAAAPCGGVAQPRCVAVASVYRGNVGLRRSPSLA